MKIKGAVFHHRIIMLAAILIAVVVVFIISNSRESTEASSTSSNQDVIEDSATNMNGHSLVDTSESVSISGTVLRKEVADTHDREAMNPLESAFRKGLPIVADFGRGTCVPCKMMQPILEKLEHDYTGRASVLILDIRDYGALSQKYGITLIPTQIFFDASGKEVFRHQGFMPEEDIVVQLKQMGVE